MNASSFVDISFPNPWMKWLVIFECDFSKEIAQQFESMSFLNIIRHKDPSIQTQLVR
jgi:hypothetical protein